MIGSVFRRFTKPSSRDGKPIVPLVLFADEDSGRIPDDGQYVPGAVIDRLSVYESAEEDGRMMMTVLGLGETIFIPVISISDYTYQVASFTIEGINISNDVCGTKVEYTASCTAPFSGMFADDAKLIFDETLIGITAFRSKEEADKTAERLNAIAATFIGSSKSAIETINDLVSARMTDAVRHS